MGKNKQKTMSQVPLSTPFDRKRRTKKPMTYFYKTDQSKYHD